MNKFSSTRRDFLSSVAMGAAALSATGAFADDLVRTPAQMEGPFYPVTRRAAIRGLAAYSHPDTPKKLLADYAGLSADEKFDAIATLSSRKQYAAALIDAVEAKKVPRGDVSAFAARQMFALNDAKLTDRLKHVWGEVR